MTTDNANTISIIQQPPPVQALAHTAPIAATFVRARTIFELTREEFERLDWLAKVYAGSAFNSGSTRYSEFDYKLIMLKGLELGIPPMGAVDYIDVIHGKPALAAKGMLALVQASGELEDIQIESTDEYCKVTIYRRGKTPYTETFSKADALKFMTTEGYGQNKRTIPLWDKANWKSQPRTMLKWRAITAAIRATFPDRIGGLYSHEELDPDNTIVNDDGSMTVQVAPKPAITSQSSTGESGSGKSGEGEGEKETLWYDDVNQIRTLIMTAVEAGYIEKPAKIGDGKAAVLQLIDKQDFNDFATFEDATKAIQNEGDKLKQELANRNADKSQTPDGQEAPAEEPAANNGAPETLSDKDREELRNWIAANFAGRDMASVCEELETDFAECSTIGYAKNKVLKEAEANCWAVVTNMITHKKQGNKSYILFSSAISEIRHYAGRTELVKMLGDDFPNVDKIKVLPEGESLMLDSNIVVSYEAKGHYNNVVSAVPLESFIPF